MPVLKGKNPINPGKKINIRKVLVVIQFTASIVLIIGTMALYQQVKYLTQQPLGFDKEQILTVRLFSQSLNSVFGGVDGPLRQRMNAFEDRLQTHPRIAASTLSSHLPGSGVVQRNVIPEGRTHENRLIMPVISVDYDFAQVYGLKIIRGRDFDKSFGRDHLEAFIVNEQALRELEWSLDSALGKTINMEGKEGRVIGVINDFNYQSLRNEIDPLLVEVWPSTFTIFSIKILAGDVQETIGFIEEAWRESFPEKVFEYSFLDTELQQQYDAEQQLTEMIGYFSALAIFISCLGLFSLSLFMAIDRAREVAIRKVLGASVGQLLQLLSGGFVKLILIATLIAWPLAWWLVNFLLEDYAYKIPLGISMFLLPTLIVLLLAILTIGYQTWRTAQTHPIEALREE